MIPTVDQIIKAYRRAAATERAKVMQPEPTSVENTIWGALKVCEAAQVKITDSISIFSRKKLDEAFVVLISKMKRISARSYLDGFRSLFAKWTLPYYEDAGWEIPQIEFPKIRVTLPRYARPSDELLSKVKEWYLKLKGEYWFAATMMLEFGMRNGDVLRLRNSNFISKDGRHYLSYTPHKTSHSSGRQVFWSIGNSIWQEIEDYGGLAGFDITEETFMEINRDLRKLGFNGSKAAYELRKICIDHIYQKYGAEMAVSISGDDIKTILRYYADPSRTARDSVCVVELLPDITED